MSNLESASNPKQAAAVRQGAPLGWSAVVALVVLLSSWFFLQTSQLRDILVLAAALVVACCVAYGLFVRRAAGEPERPDVHRGLIRAASVPAERGGALPGGLAGLGRVRRREVLSTFAGILVSVAPLALGVGSPVFEGKAADLVEAGYVVRELRVESVRNVVEDEHKTGSTFFCTSTVTLPSADGNGPGTRAEFRSEWVDECGAGQRAFVAYAPEQPELGAIGDNERALVERELDGRVLDKEWTGILASIVLGLVIFTLVSVTVTTRRDEQHPRELQGDESVLRTRIAGAAKGANSPWTLTLASDAGQIAFHAHTSAVGLARSADGAAGHLIWHPDRNHTGGKKGPNRVGAVFVSDDGWYVHGALAPETAQRVGGAATAAAGVPVDRSYTARPLDLDAGWLLSLPRLVALAMGVWAVLLVLLAVPMALPGRLIFGIVGSVGLLVFGTVIGMKRADADEAALRARAN
ncbi:hypothetical protein [Streptomyces cavernicola]|uniref:DUF3592 domain-containing protein n=1 Tax=Streptomyces cavernicola TaxID=3043613 RepID=A0ABT6SG56_9ACTN|nr:hypothetical protein [Streptomyces sp. B-S-A6]MDI3407191.1 hypothetical protein [Streptomyces sp. B-S-A6]